VRRKGTRTLNADAERGTRNAERGDATACRQDELARTFIGERCLGFSESAELGCSVTGQLRSVATADRALPPTPSVTGAHPAGRAWLNQRMARVRPATHTLPRNRSAARWKRLETCCSK
jgi:hypothetical protein